MAAQFTITQAGRPTNPFTNATAVAKYLPTRRSPTKPHIFNRENLTESELGDRWGMGRGWYGTAKGNSGYAKNQKSQNLWDSSMNFVPKHELEKFMPDISLGPKALVSPVTVMNARAGHRVTHDLLHSYDKFIGQVGNKDALVDHDNIHPTDPQHAGLHLDVIGCRSRIFRWLRRGPFFNEDHYFRRSTQVGSTPVVEEKEKPLYKKIIRLANRGNLKAACEQYRKVNFIPPVDVYRALTAACVAKGRIADAVSIFEEGSHRLLYVGYDFEVIRNVMRTAINADNTARVMWIYDKARGTYHSNEVVKAKLEQHQLAQLARLALKFTLDAGRTTEARIIYDYIQRDGLLDMDLHKEVGLVMREAIMAKKRVSITDTQIQEMSGQKTARAAASDVSLAIFNDLHPDQKRFVGEVPADADLKVQWLQSVFPDVDVLFALRLARKEHGKDLFAKDKTRFVSRANFWLKQLSAAFDTRVEQKPLPYLKKSKASAINGNVRIAADAKTQERRRLAPTADGFTFHFDPTTRFVSESFPQMGDTLQSKFLALQPNYTDVNGTVAHTEGILEDTLTGIPETRHLVSPRLAPKVLHPSALPSSAPTTSAEPTTNAVGVATDKLPNKKSADGKAAKDGEKSSEGRGTTNRGTMLKYQMATPQFD